MLYEVTAVLEYGEEGISEGPEPLTGPFPTKYPMLEDAIERASESELWDDLQPECVRIYRLDGPTCRCIHQFDSQSDALIAGETYL